MAGISGTAKYGADSIVLNGGDEDYGAVIIYRPEDGAGTPGKALDDRLLVACGAGALRLVTLQRAGKGAMDAGAFLRGFPVPRGARLSGSVRPDKTASVNS